MRIALSIVGLSLLVVAGAGLFVAIADPNDFKGWIEAAASQALDKTVRLRGPIELDRSLTPSVVVHDLAVFEPGAAEPVVTVARAEASLVLAALLRGQIHLPRIAIAGGQVRLPVTLADGAGADDVDGTTAAKPPRLPRIDSLHVVDVRISHAPDDGEIELVVQSAAVAQEDGATGIDLTGELAGLPLTITGQIGAIDALFAGEPDLPATLAAELGATSLDVAGTFALGPGARGLHYDLDLALDAPAVDQLLAAIGSEALQARAASASAHVAGDHRAVEVSALEVAVDQTELAGDLTVELDGRPAITGEVRAERVDLRPFLEDAAAPSEQAVIETAGPSVGSGTTEIAPGQPDADAGLLDLTLVRNDLVPLDLDLELTIERLDLPDQQARDLRAVVLVTGHDVDVEVAARFAASDVAAELSVDLDEDPAVLGATLATDALDVAAATAALGVESELSGTLAIEGSFSARGETLRQLLASLDGRVSASAELGQPVGARTLTITVGRLAVDLAEAGEATVALDGSVDDLPVQISGRVASFARLLDGQGELKVAIDLGPGVTRLDLEGRITPPGADTPFDYAFELAVEVSAPAKLAALAGVELPDLPRSRASATIHRSEHAALIEDLAVAIGGSELAGGLSLGFGEPRPQVSGALHASLIDLAELVPPDDGGASAGDAGSPDGRVIPAAELPLPSTIPIDLDLAITAERVHAPPHVIEDLEAKVEIDADTLAVDLAGARVLEGIVTLGYRADERTSPPTVGVKVEVDLDRLLDRSTLRGELDLVLQLDGQGTDLRTFLGGAHGRVEVTTGTLFVPGHLADLAGRNVLIAILPTFEEEPGLEIHCSLVRFTVADGKATTTDLVVDAEHLTVGGGGGLDLASEEIDFLILPEGKGVRLASLTAPVHVGGTLAAPLVLPDAPEFLFSAAEDLAFGAIDVGTLVIPVLKPGASGKEACVAAAKGPGKDPETVFGKAGGAIAGAAEAVGDAAGAVGSAVKGAGESAIDTIKGLFGGSTRP